MLNTGMGRSGHLVMFPYVMSPNGGQQREAWESRYQITDGGVAP